MATKMPKSRAAIRHYLRQQWDTMTQVLGDPGAGSEENKEVALRNFRDFEKVLSFPYNRKLAWFPADKDPRAFTTTEGVDPTIRARGEFGRGVLLGPKFRLDLAPEGGGSQLENYQELALAHQNGMLASLYARQEFIRAAARHPMTLFIGPMLPTKTHSKPRKPEQAKNDGRSLMHSEKFARVVFSDAKPDGTEYVAVVELSRTYPQTAFARAWFIGESATPDSVAQDIIQRWGELAGDEKSVIHQRGTKASQGIPLLSRALKDTETVGMYVQDATSRGQMWANIIALTASDNHAEIELDIEIVRDKEGRIVKDQSGKPKKNKFVLWEGQGTVEDPTLKEFQWMAAMASLRRIPYIVKTDQPEDANREQMPHPLTKAEANTVEAMLRAIVQARQRPRPQQSEGRFVSSEVPAANGSLKPRTRHHHRERTSTFVSATNAAGKARGWW